MKTTSLQEFIKSLTIGETFTTPVAAEATGFSEAKVTRRLKRSKFVELTNPDVSLNLWRVLGVPVKADRAPKTPKGPKPSRKERRAKKKADLLAIREQVQSAKFASLGIATSEAECPVVRRESFKEVRARVSRTAACRITTWRAKGERLVTVLGVEAFR